MQTLAAKSAPVDGPDEATAAHQRAQLAQEIALSFHEVPGWKCLLLAAKTALWGVLALFATVIFLAATVAMVRKSLVPSAIFGAGVTVGMLLLGMWLISQSIQTYTDRVDDIAVCPSGLRWHKREQQSLVLWSEIAAVDIAWNMPQTAMTGLVGAMQAWSAQATIQSVTIKTRLRETLLLRAAMLPEIEHFAHTVKGRHASIQQGDQMNGRRASFLPR